MKYYVVRSLVNPNEYWSDEREEFVAINEASVFDNKDYTKRRAKNDISKYKSCEVVRIYQP
jgi:hypothetical protein